MFRTFIAVTLLKLITTINEIKKASDPTISWSNINFGSPVIKIYFAANIDFNQNLENFWLKISLPFYTNSISPQWTIDNCSSNLDYKKAFEERVAVTKEYTEFYIQFFGASFQKMATYILRIVPEPYMDYLGFSDPFKISIISKNIDNHLIYAYNNAFFQFFGSFPPKNDLILKPLFKANDCFVMSRFCSQTLKIKFSSNESVYRIVIQLKGDYLFEKFTSNSCALLNDGSINAEPIPKNFYSCYLSDSFGDLNKYLVFESTIVMKPGNYFLKFTTWTPEIIGSHSYLVFTMDKFSSTILAYGEITNQFTVKPFVWDDSYPQLKFSMGFNATDASLPYYLGLYSTSTTYNQVLNTLTFYMKAKELPPLEDNGSFTVRVYLGLPNSIFPLGEVRDTFDALEKEEKEYVREDDHFTIDKVQISTNKVYKITYKIGFPDAVELNNSDQKGFGVIQILKKGNVVVSGKTQVRLGFTKVIDNKNIFLPESVDNTAPGFYRGYSGFRTAAPSYLLSNPANYKLKPNEHGLRIGDNQEFFVQSSVGSISLYSNKLMIAPDHNSFRSFLQIVTHPSIQSKVPSFDDSIAQANCKFYSCIFSKWSNQFTIAEGQIILDPSLNKVITTEPSSYNPISGCSYTKVDYNASEKLSYSRFRMRFKDLDCNDQNGDPCKITGVKLAFPYANSNLINAPQQNGNYFVFNNIDVVDPRVSSDFNNDFYILDAFFHVYFYSNIFQTDQAVSSIPNILMMDNLYVLHEAASSFVSAADLNFFVQNMYYTSTAGVRTLNDNSKFPSILQIYGKFNSLNADTSKIKIFFDAIEPLSISQISLKVDSSSKGIKLKSCKIEYGISDVQEITYKTVANQNAKLLYLNAKYATGLVFEIDQNSIPDANNQFMISFPIQVIGSPNIEKYLLTYLDTMESFPAFQFYDQFSNIIQKVEYGSLGTFFNLYSYSASYLIPSLNMLTLPQIATIDDGVLGNEPVVYTRFNYNENCAGKSGDLTYSVIGNGFKSITTNPTDFTSVSFCSENDFRHDLFEEKISPTTGFYSSCLVFAYWKRFCFYCAELNSPQSTFNLKNMIFPSSNGLKWPKDSVSVLSNKIPQVVIDHSLENNYFKANQMTIETIEISIPLTGLSFVFEFKIRLANPLVKNGYIILKSVTGNFRLSFKGNNSKPFCKIYQFGIEISCFFQIISSNIKIQTHSDLNKTDIIQIKLFGLSTEGPNSATDLELEIFSAVDGSLSPSTKIDSSLPLTLKAIYNPLFKTGSMSLTDVSLSPNVYSILNDLMITINILDRLIFPNDAIYIDFGCDCLNSNTLMLLLETESNKVITQISNIEAISLRELLIQDIDNFTGKSFKLKIWGFNMTAQALITVNSQYTFNHGYLAYKSLPINYPNAIEIPFATGNAFIKFNGAGFKNGIQFNIKPSVTVRESDNIFLRFSSDHSPNLSIFPLYAFENNFGNNKLNVWLESPFILGINGFKNDFDADTFFNFWIYGIQLFDYETTVWVMITLEQGIHMTKERGLIIVPPSIQSQYIDEIVVHKLLFSPRTLRMTGKLGFRVSISKSLSKNQSLFLNLDHLYHEVLKPIDLKCSIQEILKAKFANYTEILTMDPNSEQNISKSFSLELSLVDDIPGKFYSLEFCKIQGNNLEIKLNEDTQRELLLIIEGLPTPDMRSCRFNQPSIIITNAKNTKILMSSSPITSNAQRTTFENYKTLTSITFRNYKSSKIEIIRGFFEVVTIEIDYSPNGSNIFSKQLSFVLLNNENGLFASQSYYPRTGKKPQTEIGSDSADIIIGAEKQASLYVYPLIITKQELSPFLYTDVPVFNAQVITQTLSLIHTSRTIYVYRGGFSLPIIIRSPKYPMSEQFFSLKVKGPAAPFIKIADEVDEFSLSFTKSVFMIVLEGFSDTKLVEATLEIMPFDLSLFNPSHISLMLIFEEPKENNFNVKVVNIQETTAEISFTSQNQVYLCFYVSIEAAFTSLSQTYIETMWQIGAFIRNGVHYRIDTLMDVTSALNIGLNDLWPNTKYILQGFYTISSQNLKGNYTQSFLTKPKI